MNSSLSPKRAVAELKELRRLTADENGAQHVAFTPTWMKARARLRKQLEALPVEIHNDPAGNAWTTLRGESSRTLPIGGHMDFSMTKSLATGERIKPVAQSSHFQPLQALLP